MKVYAIKWDNGDITVFWAKKLDEAFYFLDGQYGDPSGKPYWILSQGAFDIPSKENYNSIGLYDELTWLQLQNIKSGLTPPYGFFNG